MKKIIFVLVVLSVLFVSCEKKSEPKTIEDKFAYSVGGSVYSYYGPYYQINEENVEMFARGILDKAKGNYIFSQEDESKIWSEYTDTVLNKVKKENLEAAEKFLKENGTKAGVITTTSGLQYQVLKEGTGNIPTKDSTVNTYYTLTDMEGNEIQVVDEKTGPVSFAVSQLVPGVSEGLCLMKEGSKYRFWLHPSLAYGENGTQSIGPNQMIVFDFELVSII